MKLILFIVYAIHTLSKVIDARSLLKDDICAKIICPEAWKPLCGDDGTTYASPCDLKWKNCVRGRNVKISYNGECVTKRSYKEFLRKPSKDEKCAMIVCPEEWKPQCGNNGETYASPCDLRWKNCNRRQKVEIVHDGQCVTKRSYDDYSKIELKDDKCAMIVCPEEWTPVCGNNGETYASPCDLKWKNCDREENVKIIYNGQCVTKRSYEDYLEKSQDDRCAMIVCPEEWRPVCGNNGKTYASPCDLKWKNCDERTNVQISYNGQCVTKRSFEEYIKRAVKDDKCAMIVCPEEWKPVCGNDGETYASPCDLKWKNCDRGKNVEISYVGQCGTGPADMISSNSVEVLGPADMHSINSVEVPVNDLKKNDIVDQHPNSIS